MRTLGVLRQVAGALQGPGAGEGGGPAVGGAGTGEADVLLGAEDVTAVRAVEVVPEDGGRRGAQTEAWSIGEQK